MTLSVFEVDDTGLTVDAACPKRMQPQRFTRNGMLVSATYQGSMATLLNQIARYRTKEYFRSGPSGGLDSVYDEPRVWRFGGHVGPMAKTMVARVLMAPAVQVTSTSNPKIQLVLTDSSGNTLTSGTAYWGASYGMSVDTVPDEWGVATIAIDVSDYQDTSFRAQLSAEDEARAITCVVYEHSMPPDTALGYLKQQYSVNAPILDADRQEIVELATSLYKRGGPSLFNYSSYRDDSPASSSSATFENIWSSFGGAYCLDLRFCNRKTTTTVPVKFEAYMGYVGSTDICEVRIVDDAGNVYATFNNGDIPAWQTAITANLPADQRSYYIQARSTGFSTCGVFAVSCYRYQT